MSGENMVAFDNVHVGRTAYTVKLDTLQLTLTDNQGEKLPVKWDEVYATDVDPKDARLVHVRYVRNLKDDYMKWEKKEILVLFKDKESASVMSKTALHYVADCDPGSPIPRRHYLMFSNPVGGSKTAPKECKVLKTMLDQSGVVTYDLVETSRANEAHDCVHNMDLKKYDGIVCISGDGLIHEVVNGLLTRKDWDDARKMPIGIVPAGTGNALHRSLEIINTDVASLVLVKGNKIPMDIYSVTTAKGVTYGHLELLLGFLSDIDLESERFRWMGAFRFTVYAILRLLWMRRYNCNLSWIPLEKTANEDADDSVDDEFGVGPKRYYAGSDKTSSDWVTVETDFTHICAMNVGWVSKVGWASPFACPWDGGIDLYWTNSGREQLQPLLEAEHEPYQANHPDIFHPVKVKALKFEYTTVPTVGGQLDLDGEGFGVSPSFELETHRKLMCFIAPKSLVLPKYKWPPKPEDEIMVMRRPSDHVVE
eukprot:CFRG1908T1